jgi:hypothetical protein
VIYLAAVAKVMLCDDGSAYPESVALIGRCRIEVPRLWTLRVWMSLSEDLLMILMLEDDRKKPDNAKEIRDF